MIALPSHHRRLGDPTFTVAILLIIEGFTTVSLLVVVVDFVAFSVWLRALRAFVVKSAWSLDLSRQVVPTPPCRIMLALPRA